MMPTEEEEEKHKRKRMSGQYQTSFCSTRTMGGGEENYYMSGESVAGSAEGEGTFFLRNYMMATMTVASMVATLSPMAMGQRQHRPSLLLRGSKQGGGEIRWSEIQGW